MPRSVTVTTQWKHRAFTVSEFCDAYRISKAQYYELKRIGQAPEEAHVKGRVIIAVEAANRWLQARQADARKNSTRHLRRR